MFKNLSFVVKPVKDAPEKNAPENPLQNILIAKQYSRIAEDVVTHVTACAVITTGTYFAFKTASYVAIFAARRLFR